MRCTEFLQRKRATDVTETETEASSLPVFFFSSFGGSRRVDEDVGPAAEGNFGCVMGSGSKL